MSDETRANATVFDYLRWRGDLTLAQDGFNEVDSLILCIISYINLKKLRQLWSFDPKDAMPMGDVCRQLTEENIRSIARRMLDTIGSRMAAQGITLQADDDAVAALAQDGFDPRYGARPLRRYVQHTVETMLSKRLLRGDVTPGQTVTVDAENGELVMK